VARSPGAIATPSSSSGGAKLKLCGVLTAAQFRAAPLSRYLWTHRRLARP